MNELDRSKIEEFPKELAEKIKDGQEHGVNDEMMVKGMISLGNLMAYFVEPDSPEEALMQQLWDEANEEEKKTLANLVLRLGKQNIQ